jgi:osmotically-inducible protein OsmY
MRGALSAAPVLLAGLLLPWSQAAVAQQAAAADAAAAAQSGAAALAEDERLADYVRQRLAWDAELAPFDLDVSVEDAVVRLSGSVATPAQSHRARRITEAAPASNAVVDSLYVDPALEPADKLPPAPADPELASRVRQILAQDPAFEAEQVDVQVSDGTVTLAGRMPDVGQTTRAERMVRSLYGVERVVNQLDAAQP